MYLGRERCTAASTRTRRSESSTRRSPSCCAKPSERALALLTEHRDALDRLVEDLLAHETVDGEAVDAALRGSEGPTEPAESGGPLRTPQYHSHGTTPLT